MLTIRNFLLIFSILISSAELSLSQDLTPSAVHDTVKLNLFSRENLDTNNNNIHPKSYSSKKIALVLSGGGARGVAQLGVIKELEKYNIRIDKVVGTSIGSVIGGFYASGYTPDEIENILKNFNWSWALSLTNTYQRNALFLEQKKIQDRSLLTIPLDGIKPILIPSSFSNGQYLSEKINTLILNSRYHPKENYSDLKIPFATVATDIDNGKMVILTKGNLSECIKASITFPLLYSPISIDGKNLVDGGLTANIPSSVAKKLGADFTIVVNSTSTLKSNEELKDPINTADQILSITMSQLNNLQLKDANVVITPDLGNYSSTDYSRINYLVNKGSDKTSALINEILYGIDSLEISESKYFNNFVINPEIVVASDVLSEYLTDTLKELTDKRFEKYTSIERNLRMIYKLGVYKEVSAIISRKEFSAYITYNLVSNPVLKNFLIDHSLDFLSSLISEFKRNNLNKVVNIFTYQKFYDDLLGAFRKNNYPIIEINKFYFNYTTNTLEIEIGNGKIHNVKVSGNKTTNNNVILREIKIDTKYPVNKQDLNGSLKNVMTTNLFRQVSFDFDYKKKYLDPDLVVKVVEKNTKAIRFSVKADNERNLQLLLDLRDENIFGTAIEAGFLAAGGLSNRIYQFEVKSNQFFSLPLTFNFNGYYTFLDINRYIQVIDSTSNQYSVFKIGEYRDIKNGLSFLLGSQLERFGTVYGQAFIENQEIKNITNSQNLDEQLRVVKLKFGAIFDTQDVLPFPTKGSLINFFYETASNTLAGSLGYTKLYISFDQYFPLAKSQTLRPRFIFGFGDNTTPLTEQFSLGGEKSFFGMVDDELRGRQILTTSIEYRYLFPYKLFFDTYLSLRYDLGNIWQVTEDIRFKDLRHGLGFSAGFDTPVGEASFSVGRSFLIKKGLTKDSFIFGPYDFYFSIGYEL
ncbi:MAG: patatin-like phospholipase family protein [Bacteroidota bacterium]|nr:patatin-like phospholipase family protein [Bacteroidota bacterium]